MPTQLLGRRVSLWCLALAAAACSSPPQVTTRSSNDAGAPSSPAARADGGLGIVRFMPEAIYSGFDGEHPYQAPIAVYDAADDLQVTVDPEAATIVPMKLAAAGRDRGRYFFVTPKKAGEFEIAGTSGGKRFTATLTVTAYTAQRWAAGRQRFEAGDPPCAQCHSGGSAIDNSPAAIAAIDDQSVGFVITTGISPAGFPIRVDHPSGHQWSVSNDERDGLISFLRSLEPRGFETP